MDRATLVAQGLRNRGFNDIATASIMGNFEQESGFSPTIRQNYGEQPELTVDGESGYGLAQWTDPTRQQALLNFAKGRGSSTGDLDTQLDFFVHEMEKDYPNLIKQLNAIQDVNEGAKLFHNEYERSADDADGIQHRANLANKHLGNMAQYMQGVSTNVGGQQFNSTLRLSAPYEPIDFEKLMSILQTPKINASAVAEDELKMQLLNQARHRALGGYKAKLHEETDKQLMKVAMAKAQESAKLSNQNYSLTGAGKLAQMISNSNSSSNAKLMASLGHMAGMNVDPMTERFVEQNKMALQQMNWNRENDRIQQQRQWQLQDQEQRFQQQMELANMRGVNGGYRGSAGQIPRSEQPNYGYKSETDLAKAQVDFQKKKQELLESYQETIDEYDASGWDKDKEGSHPNDVWIAMHGAEINALPDVPEKEEFIKNTVPNMLAYTNKRHVKEYGHDFKNMHYRKD